MPPTLLPGADDLLAAFWHLSNDRQIGMQAGPIPFSAIDRWATRHGIEGDEFDVLLGCVRAMDSEWLGIRPKPQPADDEPKVSTRPFSLELFDALF